MAAIMAAINKKSSTFDAQMDLVSTTMRSMRIPEKMQDQVLNFMTQVQNTPDLHQDLPKFLEDLNGPLQKQILNHLNAPLIHKVLILSKCGSVEQAFVIARLRPVLFLAGDIIMREGEKGDHIYFLNKGEIQVMLKIQKDEQVREETYRILKEGAFFGEVALLTKLKRTATLKSTDFSNCAYMSRQDVK